MALLFWDASVLAKRYTAKTGRETANDLFDSVPLSNMVSTPWGYAETFSILLRRKNSGVLDALSFTTAVTALQDEVVDSADFILMTVSDAAIFASTGMMQKHNLNSTNAAILTVLLAYVHSPGAPVCALVASDQRLLRAAQAEGLQTLNPETLAETDVPAFRASL
jgi:hypothetical protein